MSEKLKIGLVIGSTREGRLADKVVKLVLNTIGNEHSVEIFDPVEIDLPATQQSMNLIFNPSVVPKNINELNERFRKLDALVLVCGEYNWSIPPALTNLFDNVCPPTLVWKPVAYVSYSVSQIGGARAAMQLRQFTGGLGLMTVPSQVSIPVAHENIDDDGKIKDNAVNDKLKGMLQQLYWTANALKSYASKVPAPEWIMT